ncbi:putative reverse transcriptase domain-containing protein [Tanacetum coccineum]
MYHLHTMSYGVARWRSRSCIMTISPSGSQHNTTYTSEIPTAPILPAPPTIVAPSTDIISPIDAPPGVRRRRAILIRPRKDIPVGRLYRTYPGGPFRALTVRKSVGPLPSYRLALRHSSPLLPLGMRPRLWLRSPVSGTRFSSIIESSPSDSPATTSDRRSHSLPHSAGPSRKRCRSPTTTMPSSIPALGALSPTRVDLLLPRKMFRDSYSSEDSIEEDIDADELANIEVDAAAIEAASNMDFKVEVDADIGIEVDVKGEDEDDHEGESSHRGTIEIRVDVVAEIGISVGLCYARQEIESRQRELEARSLIVGEKRVGLLDRVAALKRSNLRLRDTLRMESEIEVLFLAKALATYEASCAAELVVESQSHNGDDGDNGNGGGNGDKNVSTTQLQRNSRSCQVDKMVQEDGDSISHQQWSRDVPTDAAFAMSWRELMRLMTEDAIRIANNLMDHKLKGYAARNVENKTRLDNNQEDNRAQQPHYKRQNVGGPNVARVYTTWIVKPQLLQLLEEPQSQIRRLVLVMSVGGGDTIGVTAQNCRNKTRNKINEARGKAYVLGGGDANPNSNVVSDGRIAETNTMLRGCMLGLLGHLFNIYLMPVELSSFDVIIGMDWLVNHHTMIVYDEKIVRIHYGDEVLIVQGDRSGEGKKLKLSIISCTKTQKYIKKGCPISLAQVTENETEDNSEEKRLKDVPTVQEFSKVFLEDLPNLPPTRQVEFQID